MTAEPGIPLDLLPPAVQALFAEAAETYRSRLQLPDDAPLRVMLPEDPTDELKALLFADGTFVTSDEGKLYLGIERD